jgi:hypothetical protein
MIWERITLGAGVVFEVFGVERVGRRVLAAVESEGSDGLRYGAHLWMGAIGKCLDWSVRLFLN